ncbi:MAG: cysteine--tRNA ligase [Rhizobiales bacterium]|nr:cysteine--tRNA ligase [Hyphomicrobiales bacterium]
MTLKLYNTLTRQKQKFVPIDAENVRMYVCGPTVYDYAHIGNARPVIVFDVLYRLLRHIYGAGAVKYVRNITDVDDKINARAAEEHPDMPLNEAIAKVTSETTRQFHEDIAALGVLPPDVEPTCTGHIAQMIDMINVLIDKGNAYAAEGHVLLDVGSIPSYGELSRRSLDEMIAGARVEVAPYKKNPADSVLWKPSTDEQPGWDSPWGRGRPGWHIECSAMAKQHLGEVFDIHGGGIDLVFPHHENEVAQSRSAHGTSTMANIWMHNGFLQVEGAKMSKSEGNFLTIHGLLQLWPGEVLRFNMLRTQYRQPIDWTERGLEESSDTLRNWTRDVNLAEMPPTFAGPVIEALCDDLNTPLAIARMHEIEPAERASTLNALGFAGDLADPREATVDAAAIDRLIAARSSARADKNWAESDRIRDELGDMGIQLLDSKDPETGEINTTWEVKR